MYNNRSVHAGRRLRMKISVYARLYSLNYILHIVSKSIRGNSWAESIGTGLGVMLTVEALLD